MLEVDYKSNRPCLGFIVASDVTIQILLGDPSNVASA